MAMLCRLGSLTPEGYASGAFAMSASPKADQGPNVPPGRRATIGGAPTNCATLSPKVVRSPWGSRWRPAQSRDAILSGLTAGGRACAASLACDRLLQHAHGGTHACFNSPHNAP